MDQTLEGLLNALVKEKRSNDMLKILTSIRKEVDWPKNQCNINTIRERGRLKQLIKALQSQHKHIIDVSLSILGNCVMDKNFAREAIGIYDIVSALQDVLKRFPKEDSINGRTFRIIGNLCHHKVEWGNQIFNKNPNIMVHLVEVLKTSSLDEIDVKEKYSDATVLMVLRTLRYILNQNTVRSFIVTLPGLSAIGSLFIKTSQLWQENQTNENVLLLNAIITTLYDFSRYKKYTMISELKNTIKGDALKQLADVLLLSPIKVIKIVMNFFNISSLKSDLPVVDICNKFMDGAVKKNIHSEAFDTECYEYIKCLAYLWDHPAIRNDNQCWKTIPFFIEVFEKLNSPSDKDLQCCIILVNTLNKCKYESSLLQEQLKCNILEILLKKLQWLLGEANLFNSSHEFNLKKNAGLIRRLEFGGGDTENEAGYKKKRKCFCSAKKNSSSLQKSPYNASSPRSPQSPSSSEENERQRPLLSPDDDEFTSYYKFDRSPSPCSSSGSDYAALSWASPCSSPRSLTNEEDSDSDDYSPVCSEADSIEFSVKNNSDTEMNSDAEEEYECTNLKDFHQFDPFNMEQSSKNNLKMTLITEITNLIKSFTKVHPPLLQLGSENMLLALLNCSEFFNYVHITYTTIVKTVYDILDSHIYLIPLMKTKFIEKIYTLTEMVHPVHCKICANRSNMAKKVLKRLAFLAKKPAGKGDIAHELLRGSNDARNQLILAIPYIVDDKSILSKFLLNCGGLNLLMQLLKEDTTVRNRLVDVLYIIASKKLEIANPRDVAMDVDEVLSDFHIEPVNHSNPVTFKLDDGRCVKADRKLLTEKSDYFSSLLNGHFKESNEDEICLHNVDFRTLHCLIELVDCVNMLQNVTIDTLLDVIALSDRYLMSDICCLVSNYIEKHRLSVKTVSFIYKWSLESGLNVLRVESIAFALVVNVFNHVRHIMYNDLFNIGYSEELVGDIEKLLSRYLSSFSG